MPWTTVKAGDKYEVRKLDAAGNPGELVATHDDEAKADAQVKALYASEATESARVRTGYFAELVSLQEAEVNEAERTVRATLIKPGWSANGRYYSKPVLKEALRLFEGGKSYADHPSKTEAKDRPERSIKDLVGWYSNVKQEEDGSLTASLHVIDDKAWQIVEAAVSKNPDLVGVSINALGNTRLGEAEGKKGVIVESIVKHNSTDIVTTPAAGGKFDQLMASASDVYLRDLVEAASLDELTEVIREARQDFIKALQNEWKTPRDDKALKSARDKAIGLAAELEKANKQLRTMKESLIETKAKLADTIKASIVDRMLAGSKLTDKWKSSLRAQLLEAKDEDAMRSILAQEVTKASSVKPLQIRGSGPSVATSKPVLRESTHLADVENYEDFLRKTKQKG
jgi:hypothetical protein